MEAFTKNVMARIREIPTGHVATYGQIARLAGKPRGARQVSRILHSMSNKYKLPWHRVINAKGEIVIKDSDRQKILLEKEGVEINNQMRINLKKYQWMSEDMDMEWMEG